MMIFFISHLLSPGGRGGRVKSSKSRGDDIALKRLAYGSLRFVQNSGYKKQISDFTGKYQGSCFFMIQTQNVSHRPPAERVAWIFPPSAGKNKGTAVP